MEHFKESLIFVSKFSEKQFGLKIPEHYIEWTLYIAGIYIMIRLAYKFMRPGLVRVGLVSALTDEQAVLAEDVADKVAKDFDDKLGKAIGEIQSALELQPSNQVALMASIVSLIEKSSKETISLQPAGEELGEPGPAGRELVF